MYNSVLDFVNTAYTSAPQWNKGINKTNDNLQEISTFSFYMYN